jgi:hypothetical protein
VGRLNFGGAQDLSGVFSGLQQQHDNQVEASVAAAKRRALAEQAAADKEIYAQWKAGEISDEEWLAHLAARRDAALDPEERAEYTELFLEHQGAILDSQMEANFALGRVSIGQLLQHYSNRMSSVEENSPAWRELATRYGQLSQAAASGFGSGGGGGGGGGGKGGGSGSANPQAVVDAALEAGQGSMFKGISTAGADVLDPTISMAPIEDDDDLIEALLSDIERIKSLEDWMSAHPNDRTVIDETTGQEFEVNAEFLLEIDKQYLRTEQALAAAYFARGTAEDITEGNKALGHATAWVAGPMTRHNTLKAEPGLRAIEQHVFAQVVAASQISDPVQRREVYAQALRHVDAWTASALKGGKQVQTVKRGTGEVQTADRELPDALRPDDEIFVRAQNLRDLMFLGANAHRMAPEDINSMVDEMLSREESIGEGGATVSIKTLLEGAGEGSSTDVPDDFIGLLETMTQAQGLVAGQRLLEGNPDPEYDGPLYTYSYEGSGQPRAVIADVRDVANAFGGVSPVLVPQGEDPDDLVMTRIKVGGSTQTVWVAPQPVDDPRYRVYRRRDGSLLTSAEIKDMGPRELQALIQSDQVEVDSVLQAVKLPDGNVWFRDMETGLFHLEPPVTVDPDTVTGGVHVDDDGNAVVNPRPFSKGVIVPFAGVKLQEMGRWVRDAAQLGLINPNLYSERGAGGAVQDIDWLNEQFSMYEPVREPGRRFANPRMRELLRTRARSSEEEFMRSHMYARQQQAPTSPAEQSEADRLRDQARRMGIQVGGPRIQTSPVGSFSGTGSIELGESGVRVPLATGGFAASVSGFLNSLFGQNPRADADEAMAARVMRPSPVSLKKPRPVVEPEELAPPPVTAAPIPLLRVRPIDAPPTTRVRLPTDDTPSLLGKRSPQQRGNRNPEIL